MGLDQQIRRLFMDSPIPVQWEFIDWCANRALLIEDALREAGAGIAREERVIYWPNRVVDAIYRAARLRSEYDADLAVRAEYDRQLEMLRGLLAKAGAA